MTFHAEPRLRTVLWGFEGQPIPAPLLDRLVGVALPESAGILDATEIDAFTQRVTALLQEAVFPGPSDEWPSIPWPIY